MNLKCSYAFDNRSVGRLCGLALIALAVSLVGFFVTVALMAASIGDPLVVESIAAYSSLGIALSSLGYIILSLREPRRASQEKRAS